MPQATMKLELNNTELLALAEDKELSTHSWARIMRDTKTDRAFFDKRFSDYQNHRFCVEIFVKSAITATLAVGLFITAHVALLVGGAALTLSMSSLIYSKINLGQHLVTRPRNEGVEIKSFNETAWEDYRAKWSTEARNHTLSASQQALHINLSRIGMALVMSFAAFAAIASGAAIPLSITSVLFAGSLFHRATDDAAPYLESDGALPGLTTP